MAPLPKVDLVIRVLSIWNALPFTNVDKLRLLTSQDIWLIDCVFSNAHWERDGQIQRSCGFLALPMTLDFKDILLPWNPSLSIVVYDSESWCLKPGKKSWRLRIVLETLLVVREKLSFVQFSETNVPIFWIQTSRNGQPGNRLTCMQAPWLRFLFIMKTRTVMCCHHEIKTFFRLYSPLVWRIFLDPWLESLENVCLTIGDLM